MNKVIILSLFFIGCSNLLTGQKQAYIVSTRHFNITQGLSNNDVLSIHKDNNGLMWIGTRNGLNHFDGQFFTQYNNLGFNAIHQIEEDKAGFLWLIEGFEITTSRVKNIAFLNIFDKKIHSFTDRFGEVPFDWTSITTVKKHPDGHFYLGLQSGEIYVFNPSNGFSKIPYQFNVLNILKIDCYGNDRLWVYTIDKIKQNLRWSLLDQNGKIISEHKISSKGAWHRIGEDEDDNIWYLIRNENQNDEIYILGNNGEIQVYPLSFISKYLKDDAPLEWHDWIKFTASSKYLLINCLNKLLLFDKNEGLLVFDQKSHEISPGLLLRSPYFENDNKIWIPTSDGVFLLHWQKNRFTQLLSSNEFSPSCRGIWQESDSTIIVNTYKGTFLFNPQKPNVLKKIKAVKNIADPILKDRNGNYWFGKNELILWNPITDISVTYPLPSPHFVDNLRSLVELPDGKIGFCGSRMIGFLDPIKDTIILDYSSAKFRSGQLFGKYHSDFISDHRIYGIIEDAKNHFWCLTTKGLFNFDFEQGLQERYGKSEKGEHYLPANSFRHLYQDDDGVYWLATGDGGLIKWNKEQNKFDQFSTENGFHSNAFYALYGDDYGNIWLSSDNGITQFNTTTSQSISYLTQDGITANEFNRGSSFQSWDGTIYFGSVDGLTAFHPRDFVNNQNTLPDVALFVIDVEKSDHQSGHFINQTALFFKQKSIFLYPDDQFVRIEFLLEDYFNQPLVKYSFRIKGYEKEWNEGRNNDIRIGRLPYGDYFLEVKAKLPNGQFSRHELRIPISVVRPFYYSWWFVLLSISTFFSAGLIVFKWKTNQIYKRKKELEILVEKRTVVIRQQTEKLKNLDRLKTRFFTNISHELRTPLSLVLGAVEFVLKSGKLSNRNFSLLLKAQNNSRSLLRLIRELLDISKLETTEINIHQQPVLLFPALKNMFNSFESQALHQGVEFHFDYKIDSTLNLMLDLKKLESIVKNLLSNALKFTNKNGKVNFVVTSNAPTILLAIIDTGNGILKENLPFVFDRFYQRNENNSSSEGGGTGIGLAICKEYTKLMGGKIWVESSSGNNTSGSTFYVELPKIDANDIQPVLGQLDEIIVPNAQLDSASKYKHKNSILVVEDNSEMIEYLSLILEDHFNIIKAANGKEALEKLLTKDVENDQESSIPDLILSDIMMPVTDGFELLNTIKESDYLSLIPFIMLTAKGDEFDKLKALRIGVDDYLIKPFSAVELKARVSNLIENNLARKAYAVSQSLEKKATTNSWIIQGKRTEDTDKWLKTLEYLTKEHLHDFNLSVDRLAKGMNMGRTSFFKKIKILTGLSPKLYLQEVRLMQARFLLESGAENAVKTVAYVVGMKDVKYFSKIFKKRFGNLPSDYL